MNFDWKKPLMLLVIVAALVASGCGGDDEDDGGDETASCVSDVEQATGEPLSPEEYGTELGSTLQPLGTELQEIGAATTESGDNQAAIDGVAQACDSLQTSIETLRGLVPPEEAAEAHDAMVSSLETFQGAAADFAAVDPEDEEAVTDQLTSLQEAVVTFQTDFQSAIAELSQSGVQPPAPDTGG